MRAGIAVHIALPAPKNIMSRLKKPAERKVQKEVLDYIKSIHWAMAIRVNSGGVIRTRHDGAIQLAPLGTPDVFVFVKGGITLFFEIKKLNGYQNMPQKKFEADIRKLGFNGYYLIRSLAEAKSILHHYGKKMRRPIS